MTAILSRGRWIKEVGKQPHSPPCHMHKRHTCSIILPTQCLPHLITIYQGAPAATLHLHNIQHKSSQSGGTQWKLSHHDANFVITGCTLFSVCVLTRTLPPSGFCYDNWPNSQISECTCSISHNAPFRTEMCKFLFWMEHCGIWNRCVLGFVKLVPPMMIKLASWWLLISFYTVIRILKSNIHTHRYFQECKTTSCLPKRQRLMKKITTQCE